MTGVQGCPHHHIGVNVGKSTLVGDRSIHFALGWQGLHGLLLVGVDLLPYEHHFLIIVHLVVKLVHQGPLLGGTRNVVIGAIGVD